MSLEDFRGPTTPESRMHRTVLLLLFIGAVRCAWDLYVRSRYSIEIAIGLAVAAIAYAVWRYLRQPLDRSARRISN